MRFCVPAQGQSGVDERSVPVNSGESPALPVGGHNTQWLPPPED
jgi:hypothetical protein